MLTIKKARNFFSIIRSSLVKNRNLLNELDSKIGDGDHGYTILRAFQAAEKAVQQEYSDLGDLFDTAADALAENAGGAIGPLLASFFSEAGVAFKGNMSADSDDFSLFLKNGLDAIQAIGGAKVGDKTLIDSLAPAVVSFSSSAGNTLLDKLEIATEAAQLGAEMTKDLKAAKGRAGFLKERSIGHQDPGATSFVMIMKAFCITLSAEDVEVFQSKDEENKIASGKLINSPRLMIQQDNEGLVLANPHLIALTNKGILIRKNAKEDGKVGLAMGHGGGHTPSMGGFVGHGLLDTDVYGPLFTCASGIKIAEAIQEADRGAGVALLVSNHTGDVLNSRMAERRASQDGINVKSILLSDDIATAPREKLFERRGLGGLLFALKIGGAAAENGENFDTVVELMERTNERTATLSVAVKASTHPITGLAMFDLPEGQIEIGTGVHGEVGVYRGETLSADETIDMLMEKITDDLKGFSENKVIVFLNGTGGTSRMELNILYRRVHENLLERGIQISASVVDSLFTTFEMGGFSLSLCVADNEMLQFWNQPAKGSLFQWTSQE